MPKEKIVRNIEREFHEYTEEENRIFLDLRVKAKSMLNLLEKNGMKAFVHGSIARGDVSQTSDIDIYIPIQIPSFRIDVLDEFVNTDKHIIMGTPNSMIKGVIIKSEIISISFPLSSPKEREGEFFKFSGMLYLDDLLNEKRVAGVNKKLFLIEPEDDGYWISSVLENKKRAMQKIGLSQQIIDERIRVLERRDSIGRTGIFIDYLLSPDENFEQALKKITDKNVLVRRKLKRK